MLNSKMRISVRLAIGPSAALSRAVFLALFTLLGAGAVLALQNPEPVGIREKQYRHPDLDISTVLRLVSEMPTGEGASLAASDLASLGVPAERGRLDVRGGRWGAITPTQPLLPGSGVGNELTWEGLRRPEPVGDAALAAAAAEAFRDYLQGHAVQLRIDVGELVGDEVATVHDNGAIAQIYAPRVFHGLPVRGSYLTAVINHGNLVLFGSKNWGDIEVSTVPTVSSDIALETVVAHVYPFTITDFWGQNELILIPVARGQNEGQIRFGRGYGYRLARVIRPGLADNLGRWEALVDAHSGELILFEDTNHYVATERRVQGGVFPVTNDGSPPDGVEQAGWPMPYTDVSTQGGTVTTDSGGNLPAPVDGNIISTLFGQYVDIDDDCGAISLTSSGDLDFGASGGTDCTTPGFGGAGNTHAARTSFYELNRISEMGRGQLPSNSWLQQRLTSNTNIDQTCNAFWTGSMVLFYRSGGGCSNTGEIASVVDHEWAHGLDDNDAYPFIVNPFGEGVADIYTALRLNTSCIGRNFFATNCNGFGDPCLDCTGVRDIDYLKRQSGQPHDYSWSNANCGGTTHCVAAVHSEAVWSLWKRELAAAPYNMDDNTAHEVVTRLTYIGAGNAGDWFSGGPPNGGCAASSGYMNYLAADDDNGDLIDGTPHMTAIFNAFDTQEIACDFPTVQDSGCAGTPTTAPAVSGNPLDKSVSLSWGVVSGATSYEVFRTEGVLACGLGKVRIGETVATSFDDLSGLQNGRDYSYVVIPKGSHATCFGPASNCVTVIPGSGPNIDVDPAAVSFSFQVIGNGPSDSRMVTITNEGSDDLNITNVSLSGADQAEFNIVSDTGETVLSLGASRTVSLNFDPSSVGSFTVDLRVFSDDPDEPVVDVPLSGEGVTQESVIFADGFEAGSTSGWSSTSP